MGETERCETEAEEKHLSITKRENVILLQAHTSSLISCFSLKGAWPRGFTITSPAIYFQLRRCNLVPYTRLQQKH